MVTLFLDDGGVLNDNACRGPQWQRLVGAFLSPRLGGVPEAWAVANRVVAVVLWSEMADWHRAEGLHEGQGSYLALWQEYEYRWLADICRQVGVPVPPRVESLKMARAASDYVTRRVNAACPGAAAAVRELHERGYRLHTASGEVSWELHGYLTGMGLRRHFGQLFGPDLINATKDGPVYYGRILAVVAVEPASAVVVDDTPIALRQAAEVGVRTVLVNEEGAGRGEFDATITQLAELPALLSARGWRPKSSASSC